MFIFKTFLTKAREEKLEKKDKQGRHFKQLNQEEKLLNKLIQF